MHGKKSQRNLVFQLIPFEHGMESLNAFLQYVKMALETRTFPWIIIVKNRR